MIFMEIQMKWKWLVSSTQHKHHDHIIMKITVVLIVSVIPKMVVAGRRWVGGNWPRPTDSSCSWSLPLLPTQLSQQLSRTFLSSNGKSWSLPHPASTYSCVKNLSDTLTHSCHRKCQNWPWGGSIQFWQCPDFVSTSCTKIHPFPWQIPIKLQYQIVSKILIFKMANLVKSIIW